MIAVTGATGFLGFHLTRALKEKGRDFVCLIRASSRHRDRLRAIGGLAREVDFKSLSSLVDGLQGCDTVFHLAGRINGTEGALREANVESTRDLVEVSRSQGVRKFIYMSSVAALRKHGLYGETKFEAEEILRASGLPHLIFRSAFIYGGEDEHNTGLMIETLRRWPLIPLLGGGSFKLQPVYVADVVSLLLQALDSPLENQAYNVGGPAQISLREILQTLADALALRRLFLPIPLKPVQAVLGIYGRLFRNTRLPVKQILELNKHEAFDISVTQRDFNFDPVDFQTGVERMFGKELCAV